MKAIAVILSILAIMLFLGQFAGRVESTMWQAVPSKQIDIVREYSVDDYRPLPIVIKLLGVHGHPAIPRMALAQDGDVYLVRMMFPEDLSPISLFTDSIQSRMKLAIQHLRNLGIALEVRDKHELVTQFLVTADGQPVLAYLDKLVIDTKKLVNFNLSLLDSNPRKITQI